MSPFYFKEGEKSKKWKGEPRDIRGSNGEGFGVTIFSVKEDPERIRVSVDRTTRNYVLGERNDVIFPGEEVTLNKDGFRILEAVTGKTIARVIHKEPRKRK